jgi:tetratricopeptide (TPR) repeat protein
MGVKKITRKQLKQDEFISGMKRVTAFLESNWKPFLIGLCAALIFFAIIAGWRFYQSSTNAKAMLLLDEAMEVYEGRVLTAGDETEVQPGEKTFSSEEEKYRQEIEAFGRVIDRYPRTGAGRTARYYLALSHLGHFKTEEGLQILDELIEKHENSLISALALNTYAQVLEGREKYGEAADKYEILLGQEGRFIPEDAVLFNLGRCRLKMGNSAEAEKQLKRLTEDYPDSSYSYEAGKLLKEV